MHVTPGDIDNLFLSVLLDSEGRPVDGEKMKWSPANEVSDTLAMVFVDLDFGSVEASYEQCR